MITKDIKKPTKNKHLTSDNRQTIKEMLGKGKGYVEIASVVGKSPTTIAREIEKHKVRVTRPGNENDCLERRFCTKDKVCNGKEICGKRQCSMCNSCIEFCKSYQKIKCEHRDTPPCVCEGCDTIKHCMKPKFRYYPERAYMDYRLRLREAREGISLTEFQMAEIDSLISPLIKKGQSIAHIYATHKNEIPCDERTLYHYIEKGYLSIRNIDLPRKVKYKPRVRVKINKDFALKIREGRRHSDFLTFVEQADESIVEMDTIIGCRGSKKVILTFYLCSVKLLLAFLLDNNTQNAVIQTIDKLEEMLGFICFKNLFSILLTDNGTEFLNPEAIERGISCERRTRVFYCDPHSPGQKVVLKKTM